MYKCEEERYEFDLNIEANLHVISLLEPIAKQIQQMAPEERGVFKLSPGLGGTSVAIYSRIIRKIYDNERGREVIEALYQNPAIAVPVVLKRLKQKDEEWKRSQRAWRKVWKEIDAKNFTKSLDHQGIHFKLTDRKQLNPKSLSTEIEVLQREQREKRSTLANRYQFDFIFKKSPVFMDVERVIMAFVEGNIAIGQIEEAAISGLVKDFIPSFFFLDNQESEDSDVSQDPSQTDLGDKEQGGDIDLDLEQIDSQASIAGMMEIDNPPQSAVGCSGAKPPRKRTAYSFYGNTNLYAFFRLYQMLFSRLLKMKEMSDDLDPIIPRSEQLNPTAVDLGLRDEPAAKVFTETNRYSELVKLIEQFITNELDASDFEDKTREMYWTAGYLIFTVDKLVQALVKQVRIY